MIDAIREWFRRVTKSYQKRSIQYMISISFTIVAMVGMIFLGLTLYLRFATSTEQMVKEDNRRVIEQVNMNLDTYLRNMMRVSDAMYYRVIKNVDLADETIDAQMNLLYETNRDLLVSIVVVDDEGGLVAASPLSILKKTVQPNEQDWFVRAMGKIENLHFSTPHVQNLFEDPDYRYRWVVSLSRAVELTSSGNVRHGVLLVDMNFSGIEQLFKNVRLGGSGYVYLIDSEGEIIYHPRQQLLYSNLLEENNHAAVHYEDGNHVETFNGRERVVTVKTVGYTGLEDRRRDPDGRHHRRLLPHPNLRGLHHLLYDVSDGVRKPLRLVAHRQPDQGAGKLGQGTGKEQSRRQHRRRRLL